MYIVYIYIYISIWLEPIQSGLQGTYLLKIYTEYHVTDKILSIRCDEY